MRSGCARARAAGTGRSVLEGARLVPPAGHDQVLRRIDVELERGAVESIAEGVRVQAEDVPEALDPRLHEELVIIRPKAREVQHQRLVAPGKDLVRVRLDLVGERLPAGRGLADLEEQAGRED